MKRNWYTFPVGALTGIIFFVIGFLTGEWKYAWLIFLANPIFYWLLNSAQPKDKQPQKMAADDEDDDMLDF